MNAELQKLYGGSWKAELELKVARQDRRSVLQSRRHFGPLLVQRPFYPECDGTCHLYVIHPPGGVAGGDELDIRVNLGDKSRALLTTPAAGKFYKSLGPMARQDVNIEVGEGSYCEWLPQETIFYNGANVFINNRFNLEKNARLIGWEVFCLGLPASNRSFLTGNVRQNFEISRNGKLIYVERATYNADTIASLWGLRDCVVIGTFYCTVSKDKAVALAKEIEITESPYLFGASALDGLFVCRYLGDKTEEARSKFSLIWNRVRKEFWEKEACVPRVWAT